MPLVPTPEGARVTFSRVKCGLFGVIAIVAAGLMIAAGLDIYFSVLDGTPLEWLQVNRQPPWLWGGMMLAGGATFFYIALWNGMNALRSSAAIEMTSGGVVARTLIGKRAIAWEDVGRAVIFKKTIFLYPASGAREKGVPLQTALTSVGVDELRGALAQFRPALFSAEEETI